MSNPSSSLDQNSLFTQQRRLQNVCRTGEKPFKLIRGCERVTFEFCVFLYAHSHLFFKKQIIQIITSRLSCTETKVEYLTFQSSQATSYIIQYSPTMSIFNRIIDGEMQNVRDMNRIIELLNL